jgi:hypothetical protein
MGVEPPHEILASLERRYALMVNRGEHRPTDDNLPARVALAFGPAGASGQPVSFCV